VIGHDVTGAGEPEHRNLVQHTALSRDRIGQHDVERREAIGRDDQHVIVVHGIDIAYLAAMRARQT
jgi:hypothetical protein